MSSISSSLQSQQPDNQIFLTPPPPEEPLFYLIMQDAVVSLILSDVQLLTSALGKPK